MKKFILPLVFCLTLVLTGCMNAAKDGYPDALAPEGPTQYEDENKGNGTWIDTLRPPINPFIIDNGSLRLRSKELKDEKPWKKDRVKK